MTFVPRDHQGTDFTFSFSMSSNNFTLCIFLGKLLGLHHNLMILILLVGVAPSGAAVRTANPVRFIHLLCVFQSESAAAGAPRGANYNPDPTAQRTGDAPSPELRAVIERTCDEAEAVVSARQVDRKVVTTRAALQEKLDHLRGAVTMGACTST